MRTFHFNSWVSRLDECQRDLSRRLSTGNAKAEGPSFLDVFVASAAVENVVAALVADFYGGALLESKHPTITTTPAASTTAAGAVDSKGKANKAASKADAAKQKAAAAAATRRLQSDQRRFERCVLRFFACSVSAAGDVLM
jgi:hypothetical protein